MRRSHRGNLTHPFPWLPHGSGSSPDLISLPDWGYRKPALEGPDFQSNVAVGRDLACRQLGTHKFGTDCALRAVYDEVAKKPDFDVVKCSRYFLRGKEHGRRGLCGRN